MSETKKERILKLNLRCEDPNLAKLIVLADYPDAFVQTSKTYGGRTEYIIQRLIKTKDNVDGDFREDLGCTADSENFAWLFAADQLLREKEILSSVLKQ